MCNQIESGLGATAVSSSLVVEVDRTAALTVNLEGNADELKPKVVYATSSFLDAPPADSALRRVVLFLDSRLLQWLTMQ